MKSSRLVFAAVGAFTLVGCSAILGIDGDYTVGDGGTDASTLGDGGPLGDATLGDGGPVADGMSVTDATTMPDVIDASQVICADGAVSPLVATIGTPCCAGSALGCDQGQQLEQIICDNGVWAPNGACTNSTLCRYDVGELPDGGAQNDGGIVGNGSGTGNLGTCALEVAVCAPHEPGDVFCSGSTLVTCGIDLTTAYEEKCVKTVESSSTTLCLAHNGSHCAQCIDGVDFTCTNNGPAYCSDGGYVQQPSCEAGTFCHANDGTCQVDVCTPGKFTCVGDDLQVCDSLGDMYQDAGACPTDTCDPTLGACDTCVKNSNLGCTSTTTLSTCKADGTGPTISTCMGATPFCFQAAGTTTGACVACLQDSDCKGANACETASCGAGGVCNYVPANEGTVVTPPAVGACTETVCKAGALTPMNLPDMTVVVPPAAGACTETTCSSGKPVVTPLTDDTVVVMPDPTTSTCMETVCMAGTPTSALDPLPQACTTTGGAAGMCDAAGACN